ncbi:hypothetical protein CSV75_01695 [Sporosarcina sp. P18a]|uniref:hypothetical protein n=1 Tax=Sporosarcina sp. P18a TaxID=2048259 RepID=UPI000C164F09|nr:hypothetical protein [Sporosarcina sp. P18a]PIC80531.1 hypothetical protein CSV75_01695 [Sporosarcina sp. P18a]
MDGYKRVDDKVLISTKELWKLLGISDRTLTDWKRQGLTQHSRGWWDLQHVLKWRGEIYNGDSEASKSVNLQQKKLEAEVAFKESQTELSRLKVDIAEGKYIETEIVEAELTRFFLIFKKSAMMLPRKLIGFITGYMEPMELRKVETQMSELINEALDQMSVDGVYRAKKK